MENNESNTPSLGRIALWFVFALVLLTAVGWLGDAIDLWHFKVFGVATENVRRENEEQSFSYRRGQLQRLDNLCKEASDNPERATVNYDIIQHEFVAFPEKDDMSEREKGCLEKAREY